MKITQWLALRFMFISGFLIGAILSFVYVITNDFVHDDFVERLNQQADLEFLLHTTPDVHEANPITSLGFINPAVRIVDSKDSLLFQRGEFSSFDKDWLKIVRQKGSFDRSPGDVTVIGRKQIFNDQLYYVFISEQDVFGQRKLQFLSEALMIGWLLSLALSYYAGLYFSRTALRPVTKVVKEVSRISEDNLTDRLTLENPHKALEKPDEVEELILMFNGLLDRLETAFVAQKRFVQNASHELKTPMTAIIAEVELALSRVREPEEYRRVLQTVLNETDHLASTTQGLLTLARLEESTNKQERRRINLWWLLEDVLADFKSIHPERKVEKEVSTDDVTVHGNELLLRMTMVNVIDNAFKYSNQPVSIILDVGTNWVVLEVRDRGIGIPAAELSRIKTPLVRASNVTNIAGSGLGLALVDRIMKVHHGELTITSVEKEGTCVILRLPLADSVTVSEP